MAATTPQLGLVTPTQGDLTGTWGNTVNNGITEYTDIAIAGTLTLTGDGAVTLANTLGDDSASNITSSLAGAGTVTAQFAIVKVSGTTTTKEVTGPSYSKTYVVDNASSFAVTFKASGQAGVSVAVGEKCTVYFNGTDYVKVASSVVDGVSTFSAGTTGLTPSTATSGAVTLAGTLAVANGGTNLTSFTANGVVYASSSSALATGSALTFDGTNNLALTGTASTSLITSTTSTTTGAYAGYKGSGDPTIQIGQFSASNAGTTFGLSSSNLSFIYTTTYASTPASALLIGTAGATPLVFATSGVEAIRVDISRNVGIGTSSPGEKLDVVGGIRALTASTSANTLRVGNTGNSTFLGVESSTGGVNIVGSTAYATTLTSNGPIQLSTNNGASVQATLDSTGLGIGTSSPGAKLDVAGSTIRLRNSAAGNTQIQIAGQGQTAGTSSFDIINDGTSAVYLWNRSSLPLLFGMAGAERMRLDSSGNVGIGTSSPGAKLDVDGQGRFQGLTLGFDGTYAAPYLTVGFSGNTNGSTRIFATNNDSDNLYLAAGTGRGVTFWVNGSSATAAVLDSSGNFGLGVAPSAWASYKAFQFGPAVADGAIASAGNDTNYATNCYFNSGWKYQSTGYAPVRYVQTSGVHQWYTAPSGTAGDPITFTQAMTLTAAGKLSIGTTEANRGLNVYELNNTANSTTSFWNLDYAGIFVRNTSTTTNTLAGIGFSGGTSGNSASGIANILESVNAGALGFFTGGASASNTVPERMRIASDGSVGIGTSSPGAKLHVEGSANGLIVGKVVNTNAGASARADMGVVSDSADITMIATSAAYTGVSGWADTGIISTSSGTSGGMLFNVQASAPFRFMQAATNESMRIDSSGNVGIGTSSITSGFKLDVVGVGGARFSNVAGDDGVELGWSAGASAGFVQAYDRGASAFRDLILNNAVTISSSGNLGLGVTPSAWRSGTPAFQIGSAGVCLFADSGVAAGLGNNMFLNSSSQYIALREDLASRYQQYQGVHSWLTAPSVAQQVGFRVIAGGIPTVQRGAAGSFAIFYNYSDSATIGSITNSGGVATLFNTTSDYRLKTVTGAVTGQGARIDALEPVEYTWNSDGSRSRGFLAHKFQEVYASSVNGTKDAVDKDGKPLYQSMQAGSSEVIADLVAEIQSLRQRLAAAGI
jgi:fibronectin-binding autotransporter adhesin